MLGWTNTAKIAVLEGQKRLIEQRMVELGKLISRDQAERKNLETRLEALARLEEFGDFEELDWASIAAEIATLTEERDRLESASDILKQLNDQTR